MRLVAGRRLTGPNLHDRRPGAIVEVRLDPASDPADTPEHADARFRANLARGLAQLGWRAEVHTRVWRSRTGAEFMFTAEVDRLYAASRLAEWAVIGGTEAQLERIGVAAQREHGERRGCVELIAQAEARGVPWLLDDECLSLGHGARAGTWPVGQVPDPAEVDWAAHGGSLPIALITGTNGKTTCARLLARIGRQAGLHVGNTSTDGVYVDEVLVDPGDWTGPGGARSILRRPNVEFAVLEVARGGMLRRGLGVNSARAALITNVSHDHLGEYGIENLADLAAAKGVVASVVEPGGRIVLGAESPALVDWAASADLPAPLVWFGVDPVHPVLVAHRASGGEVVTLVDGQVTYCTGEREEAIMPAADAPLTIGGRARHNVANLLAVVGLARALGLADEAILAACREFGLATTDNPGRARAWSVPLPGGEFTVLLDFAHNPAGIASMAELVRALAPPGVIVSFGMAGDRSDEDLRGLGSALMAFAPRFAIVREQVDYLRGRQLGVVPNLLREGLRAGGLAEESIDFAPDESAALGIALTRARPGDLVVHLVHTDREPVSAWLEGVGARPTRLA